ncbi:MAG: aspartate kinase [Treponema sp.]|jgi:aspartate kinase|nr:aspartate kinase [Treponema sp.]
MIVMKFGGSSVANAERLRHIGAIVKEYLPKSPVLVFSAMGDTTDYLLEAADSALTTGTFSLKKIEEVHTKAIAELGLKKSLNDEVQLLLADLKDRLTGIALYKEITPRMKDYVVSFGERLSIRIVAAYLNSLKIKAQAMDAWEAGFISDSNFTSAEILKESWDKIPAALIPLTKKGILPVITGFIAKNTDGNITTLGRGGSDLSATTIAAACKAEEVQVWKDVDGILTADPRIVKAAQPVETVTYDEAAELAYFGAQVLHPRAMQPCIKTGTPVLVKNSYNPAAPGTRIIASLGKRNRPVQAITSKKNVILVDIVSTRMLGQSGFLESVFESFAAHKISVDMVATSEVSLSLTLDSVYDLAALKKDLAKIANVEIKKEKAIVTIIGDVQKSSEILARSFTVCYNKGIQVQMVSQGASKVNISFIVNDKEAPEAVKALHQTFFEEGK